MKFPTSSGVPARIFREHSENEVRWKTHGTAQYQHLATRYAGSLEPAEALAELENNRPSLQCDRNTSVALHELKQR